MNFISKNKERLISLLRWLNVKPGFRRPFYHVHEIRKDVLATPRYLAVELDQGFYIGTYDYQKHRMWRQLAEGTFESDETALIKKLAPHFNCLVDIGAHIGYYTCLTAHLSPETQVISFEPNPENFKSLKKNIEINRIKHSNAFNIGLGEKKEAKILYGIDAMGSIVPETYDTENLPKEQTRVEIDTLDHFVKEIPENAKVFVKVDVEGNELSMLRGAWNFIRQVEPVGFMMEICQEWSVRSNPHYDETFTVMERLGYVPHAILEGGRVERVSDPRKYKDIGFLFLKKNSNISV